MRYLKKIINFFSVLFLGNYRPEKELTPAFKNQVRNLKRVWKNETYKDFGIERLYRIFLTLFQFASIGLYVKDVSGRFGLLARKIGVEILVVIKMAIPVILLACNWTNH